MFGAESSDTLWPQQLAVCSLENYLVLPDHTMDERIAAAREALGRDWSSWDTTISAMKSSALPIFAATPTNCAGGRGHRRQVHCFLRRALHGGKRRRSQPARTGHDSSRSQCRMLHGRHGRNHPGGRLLGELVRAGLTNDAGDGITPITYMNSTAAIKAFCGERGGVVCTSSNAKGAFNWALGQECENLFLPDQHLGRNTGYSLGIPLNEMVVWDPYMINGGLTRAPEKCQSDSMERPLLSSSTFSARACRQCSREISRHSSNCSPRMPLGSLPESRRHWFHRRPAEDDQTSSIRNHVRCGHRNSLGQPHGQRVRRGRERRSSRWMTPVASAPPCSASLRSTYAGHWKIWSKAT